MFFNSIQSCPYGRPSCTPGGTVRDGSRRRAEQFRRGGFRRAVGAAAAQGLRGAAAVHRLVERFDIEPFSDFSAK